MTALITLWRLFPPRIWAALGVVAVIISLWAALAFQTSRADRAVEDARTQRATTDALDHVATETPKIRNDQEEKQREVDQIPGADQRLPDGFGAELERVRQRGRHPR
jgi:hypothetical protein